MNKGKLDFSKLKGLLEEQEEFPLAYIFKFIGNNTPAFLASVKDFEKLFPHLTFQGRKLSSKSAHLAFTYTFDAPDADSIIRVLESIATIQDLLVIL